MLRHYMITMAYVFMMLSPGCTWGIGLPTAKITVVVIDEKGHSIEGAKVGIGFERNTGGGTKEIPVIGYTKSDGQFSGAASAMDFIGYRVEKDGYYQSFGTYRFTKRESGKWLPWDPEIKVVMRKKENPVPMYAQDLKMAHPEILIPVVGKKVGFDLIEYDWVAPYGKGKQADLIFKLDRKIESNYEYKGKLTITFANKLDGIFPEKDDRKSASTFKLRRFSPESGYQASLTKQLECHGIGTLMTDFQDANNYYVRIRSEEKDGKLVKAMYGKIQGDIKFYLSGELATLEFKYFLNPDYTRNLEWSGVNLFTLPRGEQVGTD